MRPTRGVDGYELGKAMCKTWADMINYDMEHDLFDFRELLWPGTDGIQGGNQPAGFEFQIIHLAEQH